MEVEDLGHHISRRFNEDLERVRALFETLETKETMVKLVDAAQGGAGVQIFIGAENSLFGLGGCSMIIAPYANGKQQVVGAIGVIGPPSRICWRNFGTTEPDEPNTLPKRTIE